MNNIASRLELALGLALIAGTTVLAGCGPDPVTRTTTTTTEQITTSPPPVAPATSTTTTETQQIHRP
jgi:hypothetical protein